MSGNFYPKSALKEGIAKLILKVMGGWKIEGDMPRDISKFIIIAADHTSNWDFVIGMAVKMVLRLKAGFFAKHSLFFWPLGVLMRALGGVPIERSRSGNRVQDAVDKINKSENFVLVIAPEGTRSKVARWKTGFYHIACGADIPVVPVGFDFTNKKVVIGKPMDMTGDIQNDFQKMHQFFVPFEGRHPELGCNEPAANPDIYLKR